MARYQCHIERSEVMIDPEDQRPTDLGAILQWLIAKLSIALLISTWSILSIGFLIASIVPTTRFAQPIGAMILYPMIAFSGLFVPVESLPPVLHAVARVLPLTYAVPLLHSVLERCSSRSCPGSPRRSMAAVRSA